MKLLKPKNYYLLASLVLWLSIAIILLVWHKGQGTISFVAATNGMSRLIFGIGTVVSSALVYLFLRKWFFEEYKASKLLRLSFYVSLLSLLVAGIIPASAGLAYTIHSIAAAVLLLSLIVVICLFAINNKAVRIYAALVVAIKLISTLVFGGTAGEVVAIVSFNIFILYLTYYLPNKS